MKTALIVLLSLCSLLLCWLILMFSPLFLSFCRLPSHHSYHLTCCYSNWWLWFPTRLLARCSQWSDMGFYCTCPNHYFGQWKVNWKIIKMLAISGCFEIDYVQSLSRLTRAQINNATRLEYGETPGKETGRGTPLSLSPFRKLMHSYPSSAI